MKTYAISTSNPLHDPAITAARELYNAERPADPEPIQPTEEDPEPVQPEPAPGPFETNDEYVSHVLGPVFDSYVLQHLGRPVETDNPALIGQTMVVSGERVRFVEATDQ